MKCKFCGSEKTVKVQTIEVNTIKKYYKINIDRFFTSNNFHLYRCLNCDLRMYQNIIPGDSAYYDYIQDTTLYYERDKNEFEYAISKIQDKSPDSILEIGAGAGYFLEKLSGGFNVRASEFSERSKSLLKLKNISLDEEGMTYDFICSFQVFEHVEDLNKILQFCNNKLNNNGYLLISVPNEDSAYNKEIFNWLNHPPHHVFRFSKQSLYNIAKIINYQVIDYWSEPLRIEHFKSIIRERRNKTINGFSIVKKMFSFFDFLLLPYYYQPDNYIGHTHAILLKKVIGDDVQK